METFSSSTNGYFDHLQAIEKWTCPRQIDRAKVMIIKLHHLMSLSVLSLLLLLFFVLFRVQSTLNGKRSLRRWNFFILLHSFSLSLSLSLASSAFVIDFIFFFLSFASLSVSGHGCTRNSSMQERSMMHMKARMSTPYNLCIIFRSLFLFLSLLSFHFERRERDGQKETSKTKRNTPWSKVICVQDISPSVYVALFFLPDILHFFSFPVIRVIFSPLLLAWVFSLFFPVKGCTFASRALGAIISFKWAVNTLSG